MFQYNTETTKSMDNNLTNKKFQERKITYDEWNADILLLFNGYDMYVNYAKKLESLKGRDACKRM